MKYFSLRQQWLLVVLALFLLGLLTFKFYYHPSTPAPEEFVKEIVVEVSGNVRSPGIFIFQNPPTLVETIEKAGGLEEKAQFDTTASSETLETGTLLNVEKVSTAIKPSFPYPAPPPPGEREKGKGLSVKGEYGGMRQDEIKIRVGRMAASKLLVFSIPLDLNRVSVEDLCLVPGIGESLAQEIVSYRKRRNAFRSVEELKNVKGIGDKKYTSLKNFFTVRP